MDYQQSEELATFLFTDVQASTVLVRRLGSRYGEVLDTHNRLLRQAIAQNVGAEVDREGDAFFATFPTPRAAVLSAARIHTDLNHETWPEDAELRVRIGIHTGEATRTREGYVGADVHRAARIAALGHGGQTLVSRPTYDLVRGKLPGTLSARWLGRYPLKDFDEPEEIFQIGVAGMPSDFPPLRSDTLKPNNLPTQLTSFVGRRDEEKAVLSLLDSARLVTVTGVGGIGKTRLALQVAAKMVNEFSDGVFLVQLDSIRKPSLVAPAIATTLGLREPGENSLVGLTDYLRDKELLLVLDNFEHLMEAALVVSMLLANAPKIKLLVTSREILRLSGERPFSVPPMTVPDGSEGTRNFDATDLFADRASAVDPTFSPLGGGGPDVREICSLLEGVPLAIELAAARLRIFRPHEIAERLKENALELGEGPRDSPSRQRTLEATIGWSYGLLDDDAQALLRRLAIFRGGWTTSSADAVCNQDHGLGETTDLIASLLDKSLVTRDHSDPASIRFKALEVVRGYAKMQLDRANETDDVSHRYVEWFLSLAESLEDRITSAAQIDALDRLELDHDNLQEAIRYAIDWSDAETALRLGAALWRFWHLRGYLGDGRTSLRAALDLSESMDFPKERARALTALGGIAYWQRDLAATKRAYEEAVAIQRRLGDVRGEASALHDLGFVPMVEGDLSSAGGLFSQSQSLFQGLGDEKGIAYAASGLAYVELLKGNYGEAKKLARYTVDLFARCGDEFGRLNSLSILGKVAKESGDMAEALELLREATVAYRDVGNESGLTWVFQEIAAIAMAMGEVHRGLELTAASVSLQQKLGGGVSPSLLRVGDPRDAARQALSDEQIADAWRSGLAMSVDQAVELVRDLRVSARPY